MEVILIRLMKLDEVIVKAQPPYWVLVQVVCSINKKIYK